MNAEDLELMLTSDMIRFAFPSVGSRKNQDAFIYMSNNIIGCSWKAAQPSRIPSLSEFEYARALLILDSIDTSIRRNEEF